MGFSRAQIKVQSVNFNVLFQEFFNIFGDFLSSFFRPTKTTLCIDNLFSHESVLYLLPFLSIIDESMLCTFTTRDAIKRLNFSSRTSFILLTGCLVETPSLGQRCFSGPNIVVRWASARYLFVQRLLYHLQNWTALVY